ncbi:hypothetical protein BH09SUM1_BH09SUM1_20830 [soil metagenome]
MADWKERDIILGAAKGAALASLFYAFHLATPFWQEDYGFLSDAQGSASVGRTLLQEFIPAWKSTFWRPLSVNLYWRFVNATVGYDPVFCHGLNLLVHFLAVACVGWFAASVAGALAPGGEARRAAFWGSLLYGTHSAFSLAVGWASGMPELLNLLFCAVSLRGWVMLLCANTRRGRMWGTVMCLGGLGVALLCKEGAAVLPGLFGVVWWVIPGDGSDGRIGRRAGAGACWATAGAMVAIWFLIRAQLVEPQTGDSVYAMRVGGNVFRNGAALGLYALNVSREVLRNVSEGRWNGGMIAWGALCAALQSVALVLLALRVTTPVRKRLWLLAAFAIVACGPYFLLSWNSYSYYTLLGLFAYALLVALAASTGTIRTIGALAIASSALSVGVECFLPYPAPMARAHWANESLETIMTSTRRLGLRSNADYLLIDIPDVSRLNAIGNKTGISIRFPMPLNHIIYPEETTTTLPARTVMYGVQLNDEFKPVIREAAASSHFPASENQGAGLP